MSNGDPAQGDESLWPRQGLDWAKEVFAVLLDNQRVWKNPRIPEWFGLEETLKILQFHLVQRHLPTAQVAPSPVQPGLGHFQGWDSHIFSGQQFLPNTPSKPTLCHSEAIRLVLSFQAIGNSLSPSFLYLLQVLEDHN
ncbi:hypothetical protein WISP_00213 [Willisornis vidua]|uniref:Uncharacterized protein n=1 Tax=Willisornis vidua TaxID=1566151 RepID=A0ABQ9CJJ3_9PASS|nr:hypothetical protein WISP_00213 [Willisornis vidua]